MRRLITGLEPSPRKDLKRAMEVLAGRDTLVLKNIETSLRKRRAKRILKAIQEAHHVVS